MSRTELPHSNIMLATHHFKCSSSHPGVGGRAGRNWLNQSNNILYLVRYIKNIILAGNQHKKIKRYFTLCFLPTKFSKPGVYFTLMAHLNSGLLLKGIKICQPKLWHFDIQISWNWRQLRINGCKKRSVPSPYLPESRAHTFLFAKVPPPSIRKGRATPTTGDLKMNSHQQALLR